MQDSATPPTRDMVALADSLKSNLDTYRKAEGADRPAAAVAFADDAAELVERLEFRVYPPDPETDDRSEEVVVAILGVDVWIRRRVDGMKVNLGTELMPTDHRPLIVDVDETNECVYGEVPATEPRVYITHSNDLGDWCPWSGKKAPAGAGDDTNCPAGCRGSATEEACRTCGGQMDGDGWDGECGNCADRTDVREGDELPA